MVEIMLQDVTYKLPDRIMKKIENFENEVVEDVKPVKKVSSPMVDFSTELITKDPMSTEHAEFGVFHTMHFSNIARIFDIHGYDTEKLRTIFSCGFCPTNDRCDLNYTMRLMNENFKIQFRDMIEYLEQFADMSDIVKHIDQSTMFLVKSELAPLINLVNDVTEVVKEDEGFF